MKGTGRKTISQGKGLPNFICPLMKVSLPLMRIVLISLAKNILIPLGLTATASKTDADIEKKFYGPNIRSSDLGNTL